MHTSHISRAPGEKLPLARIIRPGPRGGPADGVDLLAVLPQVLPAGGGVRLPDLRVVGRVSEWDVGCGWIFLRVHTCAGGGDK